MAPKPELKQAVAYNKIKATDYNSNFNTLLDYIEDISEELTLKVNTINSQLSSNVLSSLQSVYPVGSIYIGVTETCPIANLFGTWEKVSEGRVLQGSDDTHKAGTTIEAGLPNITGSLNASNMYPFGSASGAFSSLTSAGGYTGANSGAGGYHNANFNAENSNPIYGASDTVQPPAFVVNIWRRVA